MKRILILIIFLCTPLLAQAAPVAYQCAPQQFGGTGVGYVDSSPGALDFAAWWCPDRWYYRLNYAIAPPRYAVHHVNVAGKSALLALQSYRTANQNSGHCSPATDETQLICNRMRAAAWVTMPQNPDMIVAKATAADGTRPAYRLTAGKLVSAAPTRATAGLQCDCAWKAFASGSTDYCSITQVFPREASVLAACVRK